MVQVNSKLKEQTKSSKNSELVMFPVATVAQRRERNKNLKYIL